MVQRTIDFFEKIIVKLREFQDRQDYIVGREMEDMLLDDQRRRMEQQPSK